MPTATALDLISAALTELNVLAAGEVATAADAALGLRALARKFDQWNAQRLPVFTVTRTLWTIASGTQEYTLGLTGDVAVGRPTYIDHINFVDTTQSPTLEYQLQPLTDDAWSKVPQKDLTSTLPTSYYYNPTFPLGTISLWPVPTSSALQGVLYAPAVLTEPPTLVTGIVLPPGYQEWITTTLAVQLAASYSRQLDPSLLQRSVDAQRIVKASNERLSDLSFDLGALVQGAGGSYWWNILSGP